MHILSAWSSAQRLVSGQQVVAEKTNEITAIPEWIDLLSLNGAIVTIDAMGRQKAIAEKKFKAGGGYILALKDNLGLPRRRMLH